MCIYIYIYIHIYTYTQVFTKYESWMINFVIMHLKCNTCLKVRVGMSCVVPVDKRCFPIRRKTEHQGKLVPGVPSHTKTRLKTES